MEENKEAISNKMNPEWKEKWLKALRSGEYKQGQGALKNRDMNTFCCLGVLCDVYAKEKGLEFTPVKEKRNTFKDEILGHSDYLPQVIAEEVGLSKEPLLESDETILSTFNDNGQSFELIADYIEKHY